MPFRGRILVELASKSVNPPNSTQIYENCNIAHDPVPTEKQIINEEVLLSTASNVEDPNSNTPILLNATDLSEHSNNTVDNNVSDFSPVSDADKEYLPYSSKKKRRYKNLLGPPNTKKLRRASSSSDSSSSSDTSSSTTSSCSSCSSCSSSNSGLSTSSLSGTHKSESVKHPVYVAMENNISVESINMRQNALENYNDILGLVQPDNQLALPSVTPSDSATGIQNLSSKQADDSVVPKIVRRPEQSRKAVAKTLRNSGQEYLSASRNRRVIPARKMGSPCTTQCRLKCADHISEEIRKQIFDSYWAMGSLTRQREFIARSMVPVIPKYQYKMVNSNRKLKQSFHLKVDTSKTVRVCKIFFKNTLGISDRPIRTVISKMDNKGIIDTEQRGKHGKHAKLNDSLLSAVRNHINGIPRIESHYLRQQTTREFIDGGKTVSDLYRDYKEDCIRKNLSFVDIQIYRKIFKTDFNISFFVPKKDQCDLCAAYNIAQAGNKEALQEKYNIHISEKEKSREEKNNDKLLVCDNVIVACYDLQAVLPCPRGDISVFYYKSKMNCFNFTISAIGRDHTECFFWNEVEDQRGANEIASCVLKYIRKMSEMTVSTNLNIIFYSDNCSGQQKNQFMISLYVYCLLTLKNLTSITHKFLIKGHRQNEGDAAHSTIEREVKKTLRSGPIYVPSQYITAIRKAKKKGNPYTVNELCYKDFYDIKQLANLVNLQRNKKGETVKLTDIKIIRIERDEDNIKVTYKNSYLEDYKEIDIDGSNRCKTRKIDQ
ncbi:uncharacterized protein LOC126880315 [Diabrotica virgifera virgifera]|uniref:DUF7869 domain-containing protein n=1 Tax=Diabrotica virgifera virgifera TaxID=50390 RepID=A0ABM5JQ62_DIAVI|nr:uncharacterized protein LOC126880315 [Diabrotica virgifera virgifera]